MAVADYSYKSNTGFLNKFASCRWILAFMLCLLRICQTSLRQNIGMALVCMTERPPVKTMSDMALENKQNISNSSSAQSDTGIKNYSLSDNGTISADTNIYTNASDSYAVPSKGKFSHKVSSIVDIIVYFK